jgi:magnesium chelatase family protein
VQCQVAPGLPSFRVVGLPDKAVGESRERVHSALAALGLSLPPKRITINLPPPTCPRKARTTTCRSRWRCWRRWAWSTARPSANMSRWVNWRSMGGSSQPRRAAGRAACAQRRKAWSARPRKGTEARWASGIDVIAAPDLISLLNHSERHAALARPVGEARRRCGWPT